MRTITVFGILLVATLSVSVWAPSPAAQADEPLRPVGRLYFNATEMSSESSDDCGDIITYGMNNTTPSQPAEGEKPAPSKKAYLALSYGALACPTYFEYNVTNPLQLEGDATVLIHYACDGTTVHTGSSAGTRARATLYKNGEEVDDATGAFKGGVESCSGSAKNLTITLPTKDAAFEEGDLLSIEVLFWAINDGESLHALVETAVHNTSITAAGLPMEADAPTAGGNAGGNQAGGNQTGGNQTGGNQTGGNQTGGNQTGGNQTGGNRTGAPTATQTADPRSNQSGRQASDNGSDDGSDRDGGRGTQEISGEADTPGPGAFLVASLVAGTAWVMHRRRRREQP